MQDYQIRISDAIIQAPWWWFDALVVWLAAIGLVLWLFGRRLVRPALAAVGLVSGAVLMLIFTSVLIVRQWPEAPVIPLIIVGGVVGALAGFVLWRLVIGLSLGIMVAVLAPAIGLAVLNIGLPDYGPVMERASTELQSYLRASPPEAPDPPEPQEASQNPIIPPVIEPLSAVWNDFIETTRGWWDSIGGGTRWIFGLLCLGGGSVATLLGFAMPVLSASVITALLGAGAMVALAYRAAWHLGPRVQSILPDTPRSVLLLILAIALAGIVIQWLLRSRSRRNER